MIWTVFTAALFGLWLVISALCQVSGGFGDRAFRRFDVCSLIPRWTFFAPNPGTSDYHLLYRDHLVDNSMSDWKELPMGQCRRIASAFFHPEKRAQKLLSDSVSTLIRLSPGMEHCGLKTTLPYLAILNYVASLKRTPLSRAVQFMIMDSRGFQELEEPRVLYTSEIHRLDAARS